MLAALDSSTIHAKSPQGTFCVWCRLAGSATTHDVTSACHVLGTPGPAFGPALQSWMRLSLTVRDRAILEAAARLSAFSP
jgi:aspartate/methionine/tyrosine aminotransferase